MTLAGVPSPEEVWSFYKQHMDRAWERAKAARSRT
jgi:hypothetical protein